MKKKLFSTTALIFSLLGSVSASQEVMEGKIEVPTTMATSSHNYLVDAYDIASYEEITNPRELFGIFTLTKNQLWNIDGLPYHAFRKMIG